MQFLILMIGALIFAFYQFNPSPIFFNDKQVEKVFMSPQSGKFSQITHEYDALAAEKKKNALAIIDGLKSGNEMQVNESKKELQAVNEEGKVLRAEAISVIKESNSSADTNDTNYIFLTFVLHYLPHGLIGLLIAVVFCASWNSSTAELNSLASTTVVDIYKRSLKKDGSEKHYVTASKWATLVWGIFAIGVAELANKLGSLIEAVNILGSLFYGTILGVFLTAFFLKKVNGNSVFIAALIAEVMVIALYMNDVVAFLWLNMIGCVLVMILSALFKSVMKKQPG